MSAAQRKQQSRKNLKDDPEKWEFHLQKERERDKQRREKRKKNCAKSTNKLKMKRLEDAQRQRKYREKKKEGMLNAESPVEDATSSPTIGSYKCPQSFGKAVKRVKRVLPDSPTKKSCGSEETFSGCIARCGETYFYHPKEMPFKELVRK